MDNYGHLLLWQLPHIFVVILNSNPFQCDQIWRFIGLWATFKSSLAPINLPKSLTFLGNFCKGVKIFNFSTEIIFGQLLFRFGDFFLVTLIPSRILLVLLNLSFSSTQFKARLSIC